MMGNDGVILYIAVLVYSFSVSFAKLDNPPSNSSEHSFHNLAEPLAEMAAQKTAIALLAEGAEEIELVATVDILRRAGVSNPQISLPSATSYSMYIKEYNH